MFHFILLVILMIYQYLILLFVFQVFLLDLVNLLQLIFEFVLIWANPKLYFIVFPFQIQDSYFNYFTYLFDSLLQLLHSIQHFLFCFLVFQLLLKFFVLLHETFLFYFILLECLLGHFITNQFIQLVLFFNFFLKEFLYFLQTSFSYLFNRVFNGKYQDQK